jgi:hypothetical protein
MKLATPRTIGAFGLLAVMFALPAFYDEIAKALGATVEAAVDKPLPRCNHPGHQCAHSFAIYAKP